MVVWIIILIDLYNMRHLCGRHQQEPISFRYKRIALRHARVLVIDAIKIEIPKAGTVFLKDRALCVRSGGEELVVHLVVDRADRIAIAGDGRRARPRALGVKHGEAAVTGYDHNAVLAGVEQVGRGERGREYR